MGIHIKPSGAAGDAGEGHITLLPASYSAIGQGTWTLIAGAALHIVGFIYNSSSTNGDNLEWECYLTKGTYTVMVLANDGTDEGVLDIDIEGAEVASFDLYAGSTLPNQIYTDAGNVIAASGLKTIKLRVDGKNGSSSNFKVIINYIALWRTA